MIRRLFSALKVSRTARRVIVLAVALVLGGFLVHTRWRWIRTPLPERQPCTIRFDGTNGAECKGYCPYGLPLVCMLDATHEPAISYCACWNGPSHDGGTEGGTNLGGPQPEPDGAPP